MSNRHIKRVLSVFLSFLMILSVFAAAMPMLAGAVISQSTPASADVHFYVPECLYLYPSTAGTANFQFYLNSYPNASSTVLSGAETAGKVYFYCANAKSGTLTWSSTAALTISGIGLSSSSNTFSGSFTGSAANVNGAVITWVYTYVDASGSTRTVTAYTYIYKPNTMPSGVALSTRKRNTNYAYNSYVAMLWGFHSNGAGNASAKDLLMSYNTLTSNGSSQPTSSHINNSGSGTFQYSGENKDNPTTHFSGAAINADISRFSDLNQLPGFNIGFATCDLENSKSVKYNISTQNSAGTTLSTQINSSYSNHTVLASYATNMKAQGAINSIAAGTSGAYRIYTRAEASGKSSLYGDSKGTGYINFSVINNNKSSVRSAYIAALKESYNMQSAKYTAATWNNYQTALKNAAIALGDPTYTYASLAAQISALSTAKNALVANTATANVRHVALVPSGLSYTVKAIENNAAVSKNEILAYTQSNTVTMSANSFEGYTFYGYKANQSDTVGTTQYDSSFTGISTGVSSVSVGNASGALNYTFYYKINSYELTYIVDGTQYRKDSYLYNQAISIPTPVKTGSAFSGWTWSTGAAPAYMPASPVTAIGSFAELDYALKYFVNGEQFGLTEFYKYNAPVIMRPGITRTGYSFSGWDTVISAMPAEDTDISATLMPNTYTVNYNANAGSLEVIGEVRPQECIYDQNYTVKANDYYLEYYVFTGWNTAPDGSGTAYGEGQEFSNLLSENGSSLTLYAQWQLDPDYNELVYYVDGVEYSRKILREGDSILPMPEPVKYGYTFSGWSGEVEFMGSQGIVVTGFFTANQHYIYYYIDNFLYRTVPARFSDTLTPIDDAVNDGHTFSGWSAIPATMPDNDVVVTASFSVNSYRLSYYVDGVLYQDFPAVVYGTALTIIDAPTKLGYAFSGWSALPADMPSHDVRVDGSFTVTKYQVNYFVDGVLFASDDFDYDAVIVKRDNPAKTGFTFSGWTWSENHTRMPAYDLSVNGSFSANSYKIVYKANGGIGSMSEQAFVYGEAVTLYQNAFTKNHFDFAAWNTAADGSGDTYYEKQLVENITDVDGATVTLYAQWDAMTEDFKNYTEAPDGYSAIHNKEGLKAIINANLSGAYILMADIDLSDTPWTPIGSESNPFSGVLLGNGHTINGMSASAAGAAGLFACTDGATIRDLNLCRVTVFSNSCAGAIVGEAKNTTFKNCVVSAGTVESFGAYSYSGGLVGKLEGGSVGTSYNAAAVKSEAFAGGLTGTVINANISNSYNIGAITAPTAGGIAARTKNTTISKCHVFAPIDSANAGGVIGISDASTVRFVYFLETSAASAVNSGSANITSVNSFDSNNFVNDFNFIGFDFGSIWSIGNNSYPVLRTIEKNFPKANINLWSSDGTNPEPTPGRRTFWQWLKMIIDSIIALFTGMMDKK